MADYDLERFRQAQAEAYSGYATALEEVKRGKKTSHWIWYIFPQMKGLGHTSTSDYYGIVDLNEAKAYLADETLAARLREISQALLEHSDMHIHDIFGRDAKKVRSCMTLFDMVSPNDIFATVLETSFHGSKDKLTINKIQNA